MKLLEVNSVKQEDQFIQVAVQLYKNNPYWIRPLDQDIRSVFDPAKNVLAKNKDAFMRWILKDDQGRSIGRIAVFINPKTVNKDKNYSVGGVGFFECINDEEAANKLFDAAKEWLQAKDIEAMEGPINFGERDKFWGLLVEGYKKEPNYLANYHFSYYKTLFEAYGFHCYFNQFTFSSLIDIKLPPEYIIKAEKILAQAEFEFKHIKVKELDTFVEDFSEIYNKAWAKHLGVAPMSPRKVRKLFNSLKPVLDEKTAWFGYFKGQPIAFFVMIPEMNQIFKYINGKLNLRGKLIFLYHKLLQKNTKLLGVIFGVIPEFDGKGVSNAITLTVKNALANYKNYKSVEMQGIGDFNPAMIKFILKAGPNKKSKVHTTYRYLFDRNRSFERMPFKQSERKDKPLLNTEKA